MQATPTAPATWAQYSRSSSKVVVALPVEIHQPAVDQVVQRLRGDREALPRVGQRDPHRLVARLLVEAPVQLAEPGSLLVGRRVAVGDVVDLAREGVDRRDRAPLRLREHHDPVGEVARAGPGQALDLGVCLLDVHRRRASRASRSLVGRGRCVKTSQPACSSASSAARPPRAKRPTPRPTRPPICSRSVAPAASRPRARSASKRSRLVSGSFGASSTVTSEPAAILGRQVDPPQREVARHVLEEVDELEPGADVVRGGDERLVAVEAEQAEHEPPDRVGGVDAVLLQVVPRLVRRDPLIHPVGLDQPQERLARQVELADRRLELPHHRPGGLAGIAGVQLALELVEEGQPVAGGLVAEDVDEPGESVDGAQVRPQRTREEQRRDREVLGPCSGGDLGRFHSPTIAQGRRRRQTGGVEAKLASEVMTRGEADGLRRPPVEAVERRNGGLVVRLAGELDLYNVGEVSVALAQAAEQAPERLVVDLGEVDFVDSTALGALVEARRGLATQLLLAAPGPDVRRALEVSGLAGHFDVRDSVDDALGA